ncbi:MULTISPECIES: acyltransferase [unclassified Legionella]|uniref:acyltransferase n=1 Tax=unclassified Legionella TaxID=2622702 RepID=UPI0010568343|nr:MULTISPECIES: acyltransferase [unclassified Legionella]MDI9818247.1 acyltransferase [Legionella sp. PL877]
MIKIITLLLASVFLVSCIHTMTVQEKNKIAACQVSCQNKAASCKQACRNNCPQCCSFSNKSAIKKYNHYKHEVCVKGEFLTLQLNSFRDPLQCRKTTCNCQADYQVCMQACSGMVYKSLRVAPGCR